MRRRLFAVVSAVSLLLCLASCASFFQPFPHDTRYSRTGNAEYWASLDNGRSPRYQAFLFGNDSVPYNGHPLFFVRLPNGDTVRSDLLLPGSLRSLPQRIVDANENEPRPKWPVGAKLLNAPPFTLVIYENHVLSISLVASSVGILVAKTGVGPYCSLPMTEEQATEVFGPVGMDAKSDYFSNMP